MFGRLRPERRAPHPPRALRAQQLDDGLDFLPEGAKVGDGALRASSLRRFYRPRRETLVEAVAGAADGEACS
jgi:hypothetical protein